MNDQITKIIDKIDQNRTKTGNTNWNVSKETGIFLNTLVRLSKAQNILEIGTSIGYSALWLADALIETKGKLTTIESHKERFSIAKSNFEEAQATNIITQINGHAPECLVDIDQEFDIIFFDATKMEHISYWQAIETKLKKGGMIITDNIISHKQEFTEYKKYVNSLNNFQHSIIPIGTGLMLSLKK